MMRTDTICIHLPTLSNTNNTGVHVATCCCHSALNIQKTLILKDGGAEGIRTPDPHNAIVVLYQLSYDPIQF